MSLAAVLVLSTVASLPIIQDDYPRARAVAIERQVPIFIEVWAPW